MSGVTPWTRAQSHGRRTTLAPDFADQVLADSCVTRAADGKETA